MYELIYAPQAVRELLVKRYPDCRITDASDEFHPGRFGFSCDIPEDEFYPFAIREGFAPLCLGFRAMMRGVPDEAAREKVKGWIAKYDQEVKDDALDI